MSMYNDEQNEKYIKLLKAVGSLSKLFNDSQVPYLYYRAHETIYCLSYNAENLSRSDVSYDAKIGNTGIGLKTFLHNNGRTFQKIAEFNALSDRLRQLKNESLVSEISRLRNKRIDTTNAQYNIEKSLYHCITRKKGLFNIYEEPLVKIDDNHLRILNTKANVISFTDNIHEYSYNISKSTLFKRFKCKTPITNFDIEILDNPFDYILTNKESYQIIAPSENSPDGENTIYLPLYAPSSTDFSPAKRSGLNQWNANGRDRDENEVYIPVPSWIHSKFENFLPRNTETKFQIKLPNGIEICAKLCQSGAKGLMSNPNKNLGKWLLRDVLKIKPGDLVTRQHLIEANIDSVILRKEREGYYRMDFASLGNFEKFRSQFNE